MKHKYKASKETLEFIKKQKFIISEETKKKIEERIRWAEESKSASFKLKP